MKKILSLIMMIGWAMPDSISQLIVDQPEDTTVCPEGVAVFHILVADQVDSVEWQVANQPMGPWELPMGGVAGINDTILTVSQPTVYKDKYFRAVVWDTLDNLEQSDSVILHVYNSPLADIETSDTSICMGQSVTLNALPANEHYEWSTSSSDTFPSIVVLVEGNYSVTVTDINGCTASSAPILVNVNPLPVATISSSGPTTFCQGNSVTLTASPADSYLWSNGGEMQAITVSDSGDYTVTLTLLSGCSSSSSATTVSVNPNPNSGFFSIPSLINIEETESIQFKDTSSAALPSISLTKWEWNFGECSSISPIELSQPMDPPLISYSCQGLKMVCLKVSDINTCIDSSCVNFVVNPASAPVVTVSQKGFPPKCLGDEIILEATAINSNQANFTFDALFDWDVVGTPPGDYEKNVSIINPSNSTRIEQCTLKFFQPGMYTIQVAATQVFNIDPDSVLIGTGIYEINSGNLMPTINENQSIVPDSICVNSYGDIILFINSNIDTKIEYDLDGLLANGIAVNGELLIPVFGQSANSVITFSVLELQEIGNECINATPGFFDSIFIKSAPSIVIYGDTILCKGMPSFLTATGAEFESYTWRNSNGDIVSQSDTLFIEAGTVEVISYIVDGSQLGCTSSQSVTVDIREPPDPVIEGTNSVCKGQVISYTSNSEMGNSWVANGGSFLGSNSEQHTTVKWNASGSLQLKQVIGVCESTTALNVSVSDEESPPYDTLEYLSGGRILLYPNPGLIPNLCYKWYKDGQLLPDTYQGCVVGTNLTEAELSMFSVEVYFCDQGEECAQIITYRAIEEEPIFTDFQLKVVPNPNDGIFVLEYEITEVGTYIQYIFDSSGRLVHKETIALETKTGNLNLSLLNSDSGIYFIKLMNSTTGEYRVVPFSIVH